MPPKVLFSQSSKTDRVISYLAAQFAIFIAIIASFYLSLFFVIELDRVQVLSFTAAFIVSAFLLIGARAFPSIITGLFTYYWIIASRDLLSSILFSTLLPAIPYLFAHFYRRLIKRLDPYNFTVKLGYYVGIIGVAYPIVNALILAFYGYLYQPSLANLEFIGYSFLSGSLTHLVLTPLTVLLLTRFFDQHGASYVDLDEQMRKIRFNSKLYALWVIVAALMMLFTIYSPGHLLLNSLYLFMLCLVAVGLGNFGVIRPFMYAGVIMLLAISRAVHKVNTDIIEYEHFYGFLLVLTVITALSFLLAAQSIKNFLATKRAITKERIDPYTGIYNIAQLKEDLKEHPNLILVYIDLQATLSKRLGIGHHGKAQLFKQLSHYLITHTPHFQKCYRPPFGAGLICFAPKLPYIENELNQLIELLADFQFFQQGTAVDLVKRSIVCAEIKPDQDIDDIIANMSELFIDDTQQITWLDTDSSLDTKLDKLSFIQEAFKTNQFELHCQPYRPLKENAEKHYFEVLLRLKPDNRRIMGPAEFFPLIDEFGLDYELDTWVFTHTFRTLSAHVNDWSQLGRCSINLTAKALNHAELAPSIIALAHSLSVPLEKICFEITESAALRNENQAITTIETLRSAGCYIALDDFGTGYASFDYLRKLPLDVLKIDGAFIKDITDNDNDRIIVQAMSQVAKSMNLVTVGEFVESEQHADVLKQLDIDYAQGFGIAKPIPLVGYLASLQ